MANIKSAEKRIKQTARRQLHNRSVRTRLRTAVKDFRQKEASGKVETLPSTYAEIDKAWKKGAIHKNAAARYKSRLAKASAKSQKS